jgi:hypothetical protein
MPESSNTPEPEGVKTDPGKSTPSWEGMVEVIFCLVTTIGAWLLLCFYLAVVAHAFMWWWFAIPLAAVLATVIMVIAVVSQGAGTALELGCSSLIVLVLLSFLWPVFNGARKHALKLSHPGTQHTAVLRPAAGRWSA